MGLLIFYALISIFFSFLCSILESAFLSFTPTYLQAEEKKGKNYAKTLTAYKKDVDKPLVAILTINTVAHTVGAILVGVQAEKVFGDGGNMVGIVSALMTIAILVLSEIIPKTIGATHWKSLGNFSAIVLKIFILPLKYTGILWILLLTTKAIGKSAHGSTLNREEFMAITDVAEEEGLFENKETKVIKNLLVFEKVQARDVMTPFSVALIENEETPIEDFFRQHKELRFSRIPIYEENPNNITGFVLKDDVLTEMLDQKGPEPLRILRREVQVIPEEKPVPDLFDQFLKERNHLAIVVDQYGNTIGLVTMEDILETLLGLEIMDESDNIKDMQVLAKENWEKRIEKIKARREKAEKKGE